MNFVWVLNITVLCLSPHVETWRTEYYYEDIKIKNRLAELESNNVLDNEHKCYVSFVQWNQQEGEAQQ